MYSPMGASAGGVKASFRMPNSREELLSISTFHTAFADGEISTLAGMLMIDAVPRSWDEYIPAERSQIHLLHFTYCHTKWKQLILYTSHWLLYSFTVLMSRFFIGFGKFASCSSKRNRDVKTSPYEAAGFAISQDCVLTNPSCQASKNDLDQFASSQKI